MDDKGADGMLTVLQIDEDVDEQVGPGGKVPLKVNETRLLANSAEYSPIF